MANQLLLYSNIVPVLQHGHGSPTVTVGATRGIAHDVYSDTVMAGKFEAATADHPILSAGIDSAVMPGVITRAGPKGT